MAQKLNGQENHTDPATPFVGPEGPGLSSFKQHLTWRNPFLLAFIAIFVVIGGYAILKSNADSVTETKVWSTAADWDNATQTNTVVTGNSVGLAQVVVPPSTSAEVDLALNRPAYVSSTNTGNNYNDTAQIPLLASYVDDGSLTTRWGSKYSDPQWVYEDLGATYNISEVKLNWETAYAKAYEIQTSNNAKKWTTIYSTKSGTGGVNDLTGLSGSGRYVRMYGTERGTQYGYSLWEMDVYAKPTTTTTPTTTYDASGSETLTYNASTPATWNSLAGLTTLPTGTGVTYQARTSSNDSTWSAWTAVPSSGSLSALANSQYIQLQANLSTSVTTSTPLLNQLTLDYSINIANPRVSLTASSTTISSGTSTTLTWTSANATGCTASGAWSGSEATSGTITVSPTATSTYGLSCTGSGGSGSASPVTVTVNTSSSTQMPTPPGFTSSQLIFNDSFQGSSLNTNNWNPYIVSYGSSGYPWNATNASATEGSGGSAGGYASDWYMPGQVSVNNGLSLTAQQDCKAVSSPCPTGDTTNYGSAPSGDTWTSGVVTTYGKFEMNGGYLQVSMKQPDSSSGMWPGLWMLPGSGVTAAEDPSHTDNFEIDLDEAGFTDGTSNPNDVMASHLHEGSAQCGNLHVNSTDLSAGYHIYGLDWVPGVSITFYLDGVQVGQFNNSNCSVPIPNEPMEILLNLDVANSSASSFRTVLSNATPSPSTMLISGVQAYSQ